MCHVRWSGTAIALLSALVVAACVSPSFATLQVASDSELASTLGAGCTGPKGDVNFCNGPDICTAQGTGSYNNRGKNTTKTWCDAASAGSKTCDCNQTGIAQSVCREGAS